MHGNGEKEWGYACKQFPKRKERRKKQLTLHCCVRKLKPKYALSVIVLYPIITVWSCENMLQYAINAFQSNQLFYLGEALFLCFVTICWCLCAHPNCELNWTHTHIHTQRHILYDKACIAESFYYFALSHSHRMLFRSIWMRTMGFIFIVNASASAHALSYLYRIFMHGIVFDCHSIEKALEITMANRSP